jgi:retinol dehydrogenase 12
LSRGDNSRSSFQTEESRLDILVNNAGVAGIDKSFTVDGYETVFAVNHLGHFLLTNLLLDTLKRSAPSRIVVVSAMGHRWGVINKDDVMGVQGEYNKAKAYCISKLANVMFTRHLAKMLAGTGVTVNVLHPGFVETEIFRNTRSWLW